MGDRTEVVIGERSFELSNPDKVLFPDDGFTKTDLVEYYRDVAEVMLTHVRGRPLMLHRLPDGIDGEGFYQKDVPEHFPDWVERVEVGKEGGTVTHAVADHEATLAYLAALACITPHTWLSRADRLDRPDRIIFDLDPTEPDFDAVRSAANSLRDLLTDLGLTPFVQTTGSRGLHVVVPIERRSEFDEAKAFARDVAERIVAEEADERTTEVRKAKRGSRVFVDTLRNAYAQTAVAPYSVRSLPGAPVATPLDWSELSDGDLAADTFTITSVPRRLAQRADPWRDIDDHARRLSAARSALDDLGRST